MKRLSLRALDTTGANGGDVPTYDATSNSYKPAAPASAAGVGTVLPDPTTVPDELYVLKHLGSGTGYVSAVTADAPWGFWQCNETSGTTLADSSGNARDMTITGSPTLAQTGPGTGASAVLWPDSSGATENYAITATAVSTSVATVEAWVYLTALPTNLTTVVGCAATYGSGITDKVLSIDTTGKVVWYFLGGASLTSIVSSSALTLNTWHHVVGSIGSTGAKIRIDKATAATSPDTAAAANSMPVLIHGAGNTANGGNQTNGSPVTIAMPAFYASQLTDAQTDAHYDALTSSGPPELYFSDGTNWYLFATATAA